ncbi:hypothetical protein E2C01_076763 [Portunus trituberculatus]|uniref:Uncharacterized protein n=1 Tax=Portunus trituberculatus TaxID=210409 RepID=A0A5B7IMV5_PORTR|nr:hypothetical protein [Portunus trituberculatus]
MRLQLHFTIPFISTVVVISVACVFLNLKSSHLLRIFQVSVEVSADRFFTLNKDCTDLHFLHPPLALPFTSPLRYCMFPAPSAGRHLHTLLTLAASLSQNTSSAQVRSKALVNTVPPPY